MSARPVSFLAFFVFLATLVPGRAGEISPVPQMLQVLKPRPIGPANMSGRITDLAVYEKAPRIMYVASASGGLWKTANNGTTWRPVFDGQQTVALGAVAVAQQNANVVWVGTGEANARNSVSWGDGVYLSTDGGDTWQHRGLKETGHIGRIVLHPKNADVVYVAALGKLWGANPERGVFKSADGGKTWQKVLYFDDNTGAVDLAMDPANPERLYAALYEVRRDAFSGGNPRVQTGPHAGLYRSEDGAATWQKLTKGLPNRPLGRCGIAVCRSDPRIVYAVVQTDKTSTTVYGQGPNENLGAGAGGVFKSSDHGQTWSHINSLVPRPFYYGQVRVDPNDPQRVYVLGIRLHESTDAGKTFSNDNQAPGTHGDYHAMWINPADSHHLVLGSDGGLNYSYDMGATWEYLKNLPVAQFYAVALDNRTPYRVYGGLQDNGTWYGTSASRNKLGISLADWVKVFDYDGYYCQVDPEDEDTVYVEGQYGMLHRINVRTWEKIDIKPALAADGYESNIQPKPKPGSADFRFNWCSPILISPHDPKTVFFGGNFLFKSENRGAHWTIISPDLTRGNPGPSDHRGHTTTTIAESPLKKGVIYVGTDDGNLMLTQDGGQNWRDLTDKFGSVPRDRCVTRVECSRFDPKLVYVSFDRHRHDDRAPYLFKSTDGGDSWLPLVTSLPAEGPVYVVREDPRNAGLLYAGTEFGLFVSLDGGAGWHKQPHLPTVPVHDLAIHPRERELVIATHGRGIYIVDVGPLQELAGGRLSKAVHLCDIRPAQAFRRVPLTSLGIKHYVGENPPYGATFTVYLPQPQPGTPMLTITDATGKSLRQMPLGPSPGLQRLVWDLNRDGAGPDEYEPVPSGAYTATLRAGRAVVRKQFTVRAEE